MAVWLSRRLKQPGGDRGGGRETGPEETAMKLLILGGTVFLGRHIVEAARARGHEVTLFNRGRHHPELFPELEKIRGERDGGLSGLEHRQWDAVIDTSGYVPRLVRDSSRSLAPRVDRYIFISTISVYRDFLLEGLDETYPVAVLSDPAVETVDGETYGALKALCEQAAEEEMPARVCAIRPGLIAGPYDPTDRFTYWPRRVARGAEVLAPDRPERKVQVIDVRDLAEWILVMAERRRTGVYNATGPASPLAFGDLLEECNRVTASDASFTWVAEKFLLANGVKPWMEVPLWVPDEMGTGFSSVSIDHALHEGLSLRPIRDTIRDTLAWDRSLPPDRKLNAGLPPNRERQILDLWRSRDRDTQV
jgi:2'-hydroxyisoflavone reductase